MAKLLLNSGGPAQELPLRSGLVRVGRNSENDIQIEHSSVSGVHCEINCAGDSIVVKDLSSTNGTFIERRAIQEASLTHGQRLQLGSVEMILDAPTAQAAVTATAAPVQTAAASVSNKPRLAVRLSHAAAPPAQEEAPPAAVAVEMPPTLPTPTPARPGGLCKYHPRTPARWTCTGCHQLYCDLCVASRPGVANDKRFCRSCGGECLGVSVQVAIPE